MISSAAAIALTIAGSDSGGGAGIQADLKTFARFGVFGTSVITAVTAQNTLGVRAWERVSPALVRAQLDAVSDDLRPAAFKSGMLGDAEVVHAVAEGIRANDLRGYVLDPVMVASSGDPLLLPDAVRALAEELIPLASLITPNLDEATLLLGEPIENVESMQRAAKRLVRDFGARAALVKGGHLRDAQLVDVLYDGHEIERFEHERLASRNTHGTGCTLSAAITAFLSQHIPLGEAVRLSLGYVHRAIATAPGFGAGDGPLNHWA